jgi:hypothetical protein
LPLFQKPDVLVDFVKTAIGIVKNRCFVAEVAVYSAIFSKKAKRLPDQLRFAANAGRGAV